ncbi:MAG: hypothetical protein OXI32_09575 [bacterium]|nr:hypothetical protein [bacterium]
MPSPLSEGFGTPAWFEQTSVPLPKVIPDRFEFVVEHRAVTPQDRAVVHQQLFSDNRLAGWVPGQAVRDPNLTLIRSIDCDAGDLLGLLTATETMNGTTVIIGRNHQTCPLGIANVNRPGLDEVATRTVDLALDVDATPFGDAELAVRLNSDGTQHLVRPEEAETDIGLRLHWRTLTEWLHTDTRLGYLINRGDLRFRGSILKLTYIEGHLSWPPTPQHQQHSRAFRKVMDTYSQLRQAPAYLELMDQIEEATSNT